MASVTFTQRQIDSAKARQIVIDRSKNSQSWRFEIDDYGKLRWNGKVIEREWAIKFAKWILLNLDK